MRDYQTKPQDDHDHLQHRHQPEQQTPPAHAPRLVANPVQRQAQILQMQRTHGNKFVQRMLQRDPDNAADADAPAAPASDVAVPDGGGAGGGGTQIGDGSVTLNATGGVLQIGATMIQADAAISNFSGIMRGTTLIADSVVASNYTPGAGNVY